MQRTNCVVHTTIHTHTHTHFSQLHTFNTVGSYPCLSGIFVGTKTLGRPLHTCFARCRFSASYSRNFWLRTCFFCNDTAIFFSSFSVCIIVFVILCSFTCADQRRRCSVWIFTSVLSFTIGVASSANIWISSLNSAGLTAESLDQTLRFRPALLGYVCVSYILRGCKKVLWNTCISRGKRDILCCRALFACPNNPFVHWKGKTLTTEFLWHLCLPQNGWHNSGHGFYGELPTKV